MLRMSCQSRHPVQKHKRVPEDSCMLRKVLLSMYYSRVWEYICRWILLHLTMRVNRTSIRRTLLSAMQQSTSCRCSLGYWLPSWWFCSFFNRSKYQQASFPFEVTAKFLYICSNLFFLKLTIYDRSSGYCKTDCRGDLPSQKTEAGKHTDVLRSNPMQEIP